MLNSEIDKKTENLEKTTGQFVQFESKEDNLHFEGVLDIDPKELYQKLEKICLIDVRQPDEFHGDLGHIPGARLIVLDNLPEHMIELPKDKTIVFVCRSGSRSARATSFALASSMRNVYNLKGGMLLWNELHLDTEV